MSSYFDSKKFGNPANDVDRQEEPGAKKTILQQVHGNIIQILTKMLSVHDEILTQLMSGGFNQDILNVSAEMECGEALHLQLGKVTLPEGEKKLLRLLYEPKDNHLKIFKDIERNISGLFISGDAYLTNNEGNINYIPDYLKSMDNAGYRGIQIDAAYPMDSMIENFKTIPPCKARIVMMPNRHIHSACFEIRPIAETLCGGNLSTLSKRFSEHLVKRMEKMQENEQKLLQSLITQSSVYAKGVLN